jgi:hypothetical protein
VQNNVEQGGAVFGLEFGDLQIVEVAADGGQGDRGVLRLDRRRLVDQPGPLAVCGRRFEIIEVT